MQVAFVGAYRNFADDLHRRTLLAFAHSIASTIVIVVPFAILGLRHAMIASLVVALALLFTLGAVVGRFSHASPWRFAIRYALLGLAGAALSFMVGVIVGTVLTSGRLTL